jgi:hypothetical protein
MKRVRLPGRALPFEGGFMIPEAGLSLPKIGPAWNSGRLSRAIRFLLIFKSILRLLRG